MIAHLFLWPGAMLYLGPIATTSAHRHHAAQLCFAPDGPFRLRRDAEWAELRSAFIPAHQVHTFDGLGAPQLVLLLDGELCAVPPEQPSTPRPTLPTHLAEAQAFAHWLLGPFSPTYRPRDPRIQRIVNTLHRPGPERFSAQALARSVGLSETRMLHLFTASMGLPLRRYILWQRILEAGRLVVAGATLTEAAHAGGFSDSAHFSRVFRKNFGMAPSQILKNNQFVQVHLAPAPS